MLFLSHLENIFVKYLFYSVFYKNSITGNIKISNITSDDKKTWQPEQAKILLWQPPLSLTSVSIILLLLIGCPDTPDEAWEHRHNTGEWGDGRSGALGQGTTSMFSMSDGRVPEHSGLCRVRRRADLFHTAAFYPARENGGIVLLALAPFLVPLLVPVRRRRPLQMSLQVRVLPGANFLAQGALPLDLLEHGGISTDPGHLGHLRWRSEGKTWQ